MRKQKRIMVLVMLFVLVGVGVQAHSIATRQMDGRSNNGTMFQTIELQGTSRYFDLQGRVLNVKPNKRLYIENGKKFISR